MTTYANTLRPTAGSPRRLAEWGRRLAEGLTWARAVQQRCNRAARSGRRLDHDALRRIAADVVAGRSGR